MAAAGVYFLPPYFWDHYDLLSQRILRCRHEEHAADTQYAQQGDPHGQPRAFPNPVLHERISYPKRDRRKVI